MLQLHAEKEALGQAEAEAEAWELWDRVPEPEALEEPLTVPVTDAEALALMQLEEQAVVEADDLLELLGLSEREEL